MNLKEQLIEKMEAEFEHFARGCWNSLQRKSWISHTITSRSRIF